MKVISATEWVADSKYLPVAHLDQPISDFACQFHTATAVMKDGTSALLFSGKDSEFMLRERADIRQDILAKEQAIQNLKTELMAIQQSRLWRWTKTLRRLFSLFQQPR